MTTVISPSTLWWALTCPYKYFNSSYNLDPRDVMHWALANASAFAGNVKTNNKLWAWIRVFDNLVNKTVDKKKQLDTSILKKGMFNLYNYFNDLDKDKYQIRQEMSLSFPLDWADNVWISWQPDVMILYNKPDWDLVWEIIDIKCWKNSRYSSDEIRKENLQWICYVRLMFNHFDEEISNMWIKNPKIKFSFAVMDKGTWDLNFHPRTLDFRFAELQLKTKIDEYINLKWDNIPKDKYPAKECRACAFCDFKDSCPMTKVLDKQKEIINDLF